MRLFRLRFCLMIVTFFQVFLCPSIMRAQINTDQVMTIGKNALYFEDYILSIQYFNQVIAVKPYLAEPYFFSAVAKFYLDDYKGAVYPVKYFIMTRGLLRTMMLDWSIFRKIRHFC